MNVLGIDQSLTSTGWCYTENGKMLGYGLINTPKELNKFKRMAMVADKLYEVLKELPRRPDRVIIEGLAFGNSIGNTSRDLAGLQAVIACEFQLEVGDFIYEIDKDLFVPAPTTIKKLATGKGNSKKDVLFDCLPDDVKAIFGNIPKTKGRFDLTDAYWLSQYGYLKDNL